ncbi:MAG TPA: hypothetical protein VE263_08535 [Candidatus Angelobacter sp.]|nr:hypothetical protein [Candidatus Angelobacter sp.]
MKRTKVAGCGEGHRTSDSEGEKESDRSKEQTPPGTIANVLVKQLPHARMVKEQKDQGG